MAKKLTKAQRGIDLKFSKPAKPGRSTNEKIGIPPPSPKKKLPKAQPGMTFDQKISADREYFTPTNVKRYNSGKIKQLTNPTTGLVTNVRRSGNVKSFVDPSTGEKEVYRPLIIGSPRALKKATNAQGVTTKYDRKGNPTIINKNGGSKKVGGTIKKKK